ncbi:thiamine ABC transporter ATP-binding protein, partial [Enterobacter hormaechei]
HMVPPSHPLGPRAYQRAWAALTTHLPGTFAAALRPGVALARCLVRKQPLLLLDEPFSALDPALRQEMLSLVEEVCEREQLTMLMVSHSIEDAARIAPRSVVIAEGRILWDGETEELLSGKAGASSLLGIREV